MIQSFNVIRKEGFEVLSRELGVANAAMFLRQLESGNGNYTAERQSILTENSIDSIALRIKARKANKD